MSEVWWEKEALVKFESPATMLISGMTGSGKTVALYQLLRHADGMFQIPPKRIIYHYGKWQHLYDEMKANIPSIEFHEGLPTREFLETFDENGNHSILILDDLLQVASKDSNIVDLFCVYSHHANITVIFITQSIFPNAKQFRTISLNSQFILLFRNYRDELQVRTLGRQIFPGKVNYFIDAYEKAVSQKYNYLVIDLSPHSNPEYRLRCKILPGEATVIYKPK